MFAADTYLIDENGNRVSKIKKEVKTAMIYTMNVPKEMAEFNGEGQLAIMRGYLTNIFGECESLYVYDTKQFKQYSAYVNNIFDAELGKCKAFFGSKKFLRPTVNFTFICGD